MNGYTTRLYDITIQQTNVLSRILTSQIQIKHHLKIFYITNISGYNFFPYKTKIHWILVIELLSYTNAIFKISNFK